MVFLTPVPKRLAALQLVATVSAIQMHSNLNFSEFNGSGNIGNNFKSQSPPKVWKKKVTTISKNPDCDVDATIFTVEPKTIDELKQVEEGMEIMSNRERKRRLKNGGDVMMQNEDNDLDNENKTKKFRALRKLGAGTFGAVFEVEACEKEVESWVETAELQDGFESMNSLASGSPQGNINSNRQTMSSTEEEKHAKPEESKLQDQLQSMPLDENLPHFPRFALKVGHTEKFKESEERRKKQLQDYIQEAEVQGGLKHPNIVQVLCQGLISEKP
jgi:hypothetical protein